MAGAGRLDFYHRVVSKAVRARYLSDDDDASNLSGSGRSGSGRSGGAGGAGGAGGGSGGQQKRAKTTTINGGGSGCSGRWSASRKYRWWHGHLADYFEGLSTGSE